METPTLTRGASIDCARPGVKTTIAALGLKIACHRRQSTCFSGLCRHIHQNPAKSVYWRSNLPSAASEIDQRSSAFTIPSIALMRQSLFVRFFKSVGLDIKPNSIRTEGMSGAFNTENPAERRGRDLIRPIPSAMPSTSSSASFSDLG